MLKAPTREGGQVKVKPPDANKDRAKRKRLSRGDGDYGLIEMCMQCFGKREY